VVFADPADAQTECTVADTSSLAIGAILEHCPEVLSQIVPVAAGQLRDRLLAVLRDPETLNRGLAELGRRRGLNGLLRDLNLRFVNLQQGGNESVLGLTYDWARDVKHDTLSTSDDDVRAIGLHLTGSASGTVALDRNLNPRDFLDSKLALGVFGSFGGVVPGDTLFATLNRLADLLTEFETLEALEASPAFRQFFGSIRNSLSTQYYISAALNGGLEADQRFQTKQWAYGLNLGLDIKAWNPNSLLARWNVFDWPAAALRYLFGSDDGFRPSGAAIPTLILGLDQVDPTDNDERAMLTDLDAFARFRAEVAWRSILVPRDDGSISVEAGWRLYHEIDAPDALRAADLDSFSHVFVAITVPNGMYAAWSHGRFPFDQQKDQVYELGFRTSF
jgi:hypothetical protein